jgi:uncharacterized phage protein (TIGR01671 family)
MRTIKFRVWDETEKKYISDNTCFVIYDGKPCENDYGDCIGMPHWSLEQFTGLNDKNGKEIYEGDIVILTDSKGKELHCAVENITGAFWYVIKMNQLTIGMWEYHNFMNKSVEVIGNIHEGVQQ